MPRRARIYTEEGLFHILTRGNNKQRVFHDEADFKTYKKIVKQLKEEQPFKLYHYCLMNNHVHLIIETNKLTELSKLMKRINLLYYNHYKRKYGYAGHFWQDRFKSLLIERSEYLLACGLYIERNPVKAKIVNSAEKYQHSSYNYYAYGKEDGLTDQDIYYDEIGYNDKQRQREYRRLLLDKEKGISNIVFKQLFLGTRKFIKQMEDKFKVNNTRLEKGRPKKIK
ncbi:MAG: transposase [Candidatus Omnitrophica bacterium]|nr:transposase [Candidatus Omnitrophota bacterium]